MCGSHRLRYCLATTLLAVTALLVTSAIGLRSFSDSIGVRRLKVSWKCSIQEWKVYYWKTGEQPASETLGTTDGDIDISQKPLEGYLPFAVLIPGVTRPFSDVVVGERWLIVVLSKGGQSYRRVFTIDSRNLTNGTIEIECPNETALSEWEKIEWFSK